MTDNRLFRAAVWAWLVEATGYPETAIYRADQSGPDAYPDEYITYKILTTTPHHSADYEKTAGLALGDVVHRFLHHVRVVVSVNCYSRDGDIVLWNAWGARYNWTARQILNNVRAAVVATSDIRDLTSLGPTGHRPRFQADYTFNWSYVTTVEDYTVDQTEITGTIDEETISIVTDNGREYPPEPEED